MSTEQRLDGHIAEIRQGKPVTHELLAFVIRLARFYSRGAPELVRRAERILQLWVERIGEGKTDLNEPSLRTFTVDWVSREGCASRELTLFFAHCAAGRVGRPALRAANCLQGIVTLEGADWQNGMGRFCASPLFEALDWEAHGELFSAALAAGEGALQRAQTLELVIIRLLAQRIGSRSESVCRKVFWLLIKMREPVVARFLDNREVSFAIPFEMKQEAIKRLLSWRDTPPHLRQELIGAILGTTAWGPWELAQLLTLFYEQRYEPGVAQLMPLIQRLPPLQAEFALTTATHPEARRALEQVVRPSR